MMRGQPHEDKDLKEKRISSEFLQFTVFLAEGEAWGTIQTLGEPNEASHHIFNMSNLFIQTF